LACHTFGAKVRGGPKRKIPKKVLLKIVAFTGAFFFDFLCASFDDSIKRKRYKKDDLNR
jgi:hypothetical protein